MGFALLVIIWLITFGSAYFFIAKTWWLPVGASAAAHWIDGQFTLTYVLMGIVFFAAQLSLGYISNVSTVGPKVTFLNGLTRQVVGRKSKQRWISPSSDPGN